MVLKRSMVASLPTGLSVPTAWLGALGLSCLSLACARTIDERMVAVSRLLDEARSFQAEQYAPEAFQRAEDLLLQARSELESQQAKPWFLSTERRARELLQASEAAASLVRAEAAAAAVRARKETVRAMSGAHLALDRASEAYWRTPRGEDTRIDLRQMRADLDTLVGDLTEAEVALEQGEFLLAGRMAAEVESRASSVAALIERATAYRLAEPAGGASSLNRGAPDSPARAPGPPLPGASRPASKTARYGRRAG